MINQEIKPNVDAISIYNLLESKPIDELVTYDELREVCLKKEETNFRNSISRAIYKLKNNGIIYYNVRGIGYQRANDSEIVRYSPNHIAKAKKRLRTGIKELDASDDSKLTNDEIIKKNTYYAVSGLMLHLTKPKQTRAIQEKVANNTLSFNPRDTLKYLVKS